MYQLLFDNDSESEVTALESLDESTGTNSKKYHIKGIFSTIGEKNRNGRIYPMALWETEIQRYQGNFASGSIDTLMEYEHPARSNVDPMEAVAKINTLRIDGNYVMGEAVLLNNDRANQLKTLIDNGVKLSVSSRGLGNVKNGIVENFKLVTYDIVATPSDFNATMNGLVEGHKLNEGIVEGMNFEVDTNNNVVRCSDFDHDAVRDAVQQKFAAVLAELIK